ncbi:MAG: pyridoxamine 5'-phosphate oxidase family protein [Clostridia bacterium]|nr:pyridoxamine 5'-phosphate oxidase family protein [Clostridia bacterium]
MFRELTRIKNKLSDEACIRILTTEKRGVLSVNGDGGYPYAMPMNHYYNPDDGAIYFHCGKTGHRLDSLKKDGRVSFCVYDGGFRKDGEWALNIGSVIVFGKIEIIDEPSVTADISEKLSLKFTADADYIRNEIKNFAANTLILKLKPENICGKLVNES